MALEEAAAVVASYLERAAAHKAPAADETLLRTRYAPSQSSRY